MKVTKILETIKTGTGKKGAWTLVEVEVGDKKARGFMPVVVGDEVDLEFNQQYNNYSFKVLGPSTIPNAPPESDVMKALETLLDRTGEILERVKSLEGITDEATAREIFPDDE